MAWKNSKRLSGLPAKARRTFLRVRIRKEDQSCLTDETQAFPLAVALRDALSARLGIQTEELECTAGRRRREDGTLCTSIFVFRQKMPRAMPPPPENSWRIFCVMRTSVCSAKVMAVKRPVPTILSFDLCYQSRELNRNNGLNVLTPAWFYLARSSPQVRIFGSSTVAETMRLEESVLSASLLHPEAIIHLHLGPAFFVAPRRW